VKQLDVKKAFDEAPDLAGNVVDINDAEATERILNELAALDPIQYDMVRKAKAKDLGIRDSTLDAEVKKRRPREETGQGGEIKLSEPEPWPESVGGAELLGGLMAAFRRYLVLPFGAAEVLALWTVHAHAFEAFQHTPRLDIRSPEKGCGKTIVLDVLESLTPRSVRTENVTTAVLFRLVDAHKPTLLIDEVDSFLKNNEDLRGALNAGHRRGGQHLRCEGDGNDLRGFKTFAPVAMAGIGRLPGTLLDRSIPITMKRRHAKEEIEFFRQDRTDDLKVLSRKSARWVNDNMLLLTEADPEIPEFLLNRAADNWRPLLAIADLIGGEWPDLARRTAKEVVEEDSSHRTQLLLDIKGVFEDRAVDRITSADLCADLAKMEDRPWPEWGKNGKPITTRALAKQLSAFEIKPRTIRLEVGPGTAKGYLLDDFLDAFSRYSPSLSVTPSQPQKPGGYSGNPIVTPETNVTDKNPPKPAENRQCYDVTDRNPEIGGLWESDL
jgi:putative DNA primase/helicase